MAKLNDTQKSLLTLGIGVVVALGAGYMTWTDLEELSVVKEEIRVKTEEMEKNKVQIARTEGVKREVVAYKAIVAQNSKILPTDSDIHNFGRFISKLERDNNLTLKSVPSYKVPDTSKGDPIVPIPMQITFSGTTRGFLRLLNTLENHDRLVSITSFGITPGQSKVAGVDAVHEFNLQFIVYRYDAKVGAKENLIKREEEELIASTREVKDLVAEKGKPKVLEQYQLMPGRDTRRDLFADPRRLVAGSDLGITGGESSFPAQVRKLESLDVLLQRARLDLDTFIEAREQKDYLKEHSARVSFGRSREEFEVYLQDVTSVVPPFSDKTLMERFAAEIDVPYKRLLDDANKFGVSTKGADKSFTAAVARELLGEMKELVASRDWSAASEKATSVEQFVKDADSVEEAAQPILAEIQRLGVRSHHQALFSKKQIKVTGIVRMERASAIIVNGKTLGPGKRLDAETEFLRVEDGDRLVFSLKGHEVDHIPPRPALLKVEPDVLDF